MQGDAAAVQHHGARASADARRPLTMLLIGSDARIARASDGNIGRRSDTIMLARIGGGRPTTLMSIPRDVHVTIPLKTGGSRIGKINEAFGEGARRSPPRW